MFAFFKTRQSIYIEAVRKAARQLMADFGATTTLEVKNWLRNQGFIAFQADVSQMMDIVAQEEGWAFDYNGRFRIYFVPEVEMFFSMN